MAAEVKIILTKRLELLFRTVLALPKASRRGFDCRMMSFTCYNMYIHTNTVTQCETQQEHQMAGGSKVSPVIACCLYLNFRSSSRYFGNVTHDVFGSHCLPSTTLTTTTIPRKTGRSTSQNNNAARLLHYKIPKPYVVLKQDSPNDDTLILSINHHVSVHVISQGVYVGWILILGLRRKRLVFSSGS